MLSAYLVGCAGSSQSVVSSGELSGGMLGLGGEDHEFWADWRAREPAAPPLMSGRQEVHLFEAWRVEDEALRGLVLDSAFYMLGAVQGGVSGEEARGVQSVLMRLSARFDEAKLEVDFFSAADGSAEGLLWRLVEPGGGGVWIEAERRAGSEVWPDRWTLRVEPAFEEAEGLVIWWEETDSGWVVREAKGAGALKAVARLNEVQEEQQAALLRVVAESLWERVVQQRFVEPDFELCAALEAGALAPGWPAALGEAVEPRGLDDFVSDTVFWPRGGQDILEGL